MAFALFAAVTVAEVFAISVVYSLAPAALYALATENDAK